MFGTNPQYGGANVGLQPCLPAASAQTQLFVPSAATLAGQYGALTYAANGYCVEVPDFNLAAGVELWQCNSGVNQMWAFQASSGQLVTQDDINYCAGVC